MKRIYEARKHSRAHALLLLLAAILVVCPYQSKILAQDGQKSIKIGFLIRDKRDLASIQVAELAIAHANAAGGFQGRTLQLITKSCDGPWGVGSKRAVELVYDDEVTMIVAALDGRNAHLAEQVTAKSHVVLLSTQSSDPSLSRAYVPWYFRMVPDDRQQAAVLIEDIYQKQQLSKVVLVSLDDYDGKMSVESMKELMVKKGLQTPESFINLPEKTLMQKIAHHPPQAMVLAGSAAHVRQLVDDIHVSFPAIRLYAFLNMYNFYAITRTPFPKNIRIVQSDSPAHSQRPSFEKAFLEKYGQMPSPAQAYIYDGISLAAEAIRTYGASPEALRSNFKSITYLGLTGEIKFGKLGNRSNEWILSK
ncbi:MAG: amino acid ABC transporter substrate-binding protein [Cyclobacteriaceae bacterium]|nr:amino acid ABC transporter substrate-binding protein [Cyclobacteriaceae bacterium]